MKDISYQLKTFFYILISSAILCFIISIFSKRNKTLYIIFLTLGIGILLKSLIILLLITEHLKTVTITTS